MKEYKLKDLENLLYGIANYFRANGNINNKEIENVVLPILSFKRFLDQREDTIKEKLKSKTIEIFENNKDLKNDLFELNNEYLKVLNNEISFEEFSNSFEKEKVKQLMELYEYIIDSELVNFRNIYKPHEDRLNDIFITFEDIYNYNFINDEEKEIKYRLKNGFVIKTNAKDNKDFYKFVLRSFSNQLLQVIFKNFEFVGRYLDNLLTKDDFEFILNKFVNEHIGDNVSEDTFGKAYIYLIEQFGSDAGKKNGEFFTPDKIGKICANILKPELKNDRPIYIADIASGTATLLVNIFLYLKEKNPNLTSKEISKKVRFVLQEKERKTLYMGVLGLLLVGYDFDEDFEEQIFHANTLLEYNTNIGKLYRKKIDYFVGNPPYGSKILSKNDYEKILQLKEDRWNYGYPKKDQLEWFFVQSLVDLADPKQAKGTVILPTGSLFKENSKKDFIKEDIIEGVISFPDSMFQTTTIPVNILVFNFNKEENLKNKIFMINSTEDFIKKDKFKDVDENKIIKVYNNKEEIKGYSGFVDIKELEEMDYNLVPTKYFFELPPEENIDINKLLEDINNINNKLCNNDFLDNIFKQVKDIENKGS